VSIDLARFFDEIPHNLILKLIRRKIADERLVTLIARALKAGTGCNPFWLKRWWISNGFTGAVIWRRTGSKWGKPAAVGAWIAPINVTELR
jgi:hypothetical protein